MMQHVPVWAQETNSYFSVPTCNVHLTAGQESCYCRALIYCLILTPKCSQLSPTKNRNWINWILYACLRVDVGICALTVPPMRKSSPATYCMRSCCWQHPSTPMIQPKRMMDTAMPTKPAVILLRSASRGENLTYRSWTEKMNGYLLNW